MSDRIERALERARRQARAAFVPFLVAGDPSPRATVPLLRALELGGADIVELGVPFSDPIADGPTIQRSSERALAHGVTLEGVLAMVREVRLLSRVPVVLFSYFNPVHAYGVERFAADAAAAGVDGVLLVDVPAEELAGPARILSRERLTVVPLLAPTSTPERMRAVRRLHGGLVYLVARSGVTGPRRTLEADLEERTNLVRRVSGAAVAVGFGISTPEQVQRVAAFADAVVVGSALVEHIATRGAGPGLEDDVAAFTRTLAAGTSRPRTVRRPRT